LSRPTGPTAALRHALADPRSAIDVLRSHKLRLVVRLTDGLGGTGRRRVGRLLLAISRPFLLVSSRSAIGAPLRILGLRWVTSTAAATDDAERLGTDPRTSRRGAIRLARVCLEIGAPAAAGRILDRVNPPPSSPVELVTRADVDWRLGRYTSAADVAGRALELRPGDPTARLIRDRARGELAVLTPGWRPRLDVALPRPEPVPGRVLHLLTNSLPYRQAGYTVRAQSVARCQIDVGLDPQMATRAGFPANEGIRGVRATSVVDGVTYHRILPDLDPRTVADALVTANAEAARALVERLRPAVLHPASNHVNAQVAFALRDRYGIPVVYEVRGFLEETWRSRAGEDVAASDRYLATRAVETACMRDADAVVTLSETMREDILERGGTEPDRVIVVPNAVDVHRFVPGPRDPALATRLGIGAEPVIGYISSFTGYEGIRYLIEATAELKRRGRSIRCLLVGDGEERPALEAAARAAGVDDGTVLFTGRVAHDQVLEYYRLIDVFVVPRTNDRVSRLVTPLKPYEAMAMERALVVSAVGALLEIVTDGVTGRSFTPEDPISLADVIEPLLDDPAERARLGGAARAWVSEHRTWAQNGRRYRELYERLGVA
jgi:PEP-CTERM/exosortase A-associated glycosyltransferase